MKVQPETLKYLTEVSIKGRKSVFMSLDPFFSLRGWHCLYIYLLVVVASLIGLERRYKHGGLKFARGYLTQYIINFMIISVNSCYICIFICAVIHTIQKPGTACKHELL